MSNRWDERYAKGEYGDKDPEPAVADLARRLAPGRALDVATGLGRHALWLATHGWDVTAVDYSEVALAKLRERAGADRIRIVRADLEAGQFVIEPRSFNLIVDCCFLWRPLFAAMRDGVAPGGYFAGVYPVTGFARRGAPANPAYLLEPAELLGFFHDWDIVHYFEGRPGNNPDRRPRAEIVARKPRAD